MEEERIFLVAEKIQKTIEKLTTDLSRKIWQKIMLLN